MNVKPDYSEYLKQPGRFEITERDWLASPQGHDYHARCVREVLAMVDAQSVVEIGCGTGHLASRIDVESYLLIDANAECLAAAHQRKPNAKAMLSDVRALQFAEPVADVVLAFGFLKHFSTNEWWDIFHRVASAGDVFAFDLPIKHDQDELFIDDGVHYPHVWASNQKLAAAFEAHGYDIVYRDESLYDVCFEHVMAVRRRTDQ